MIEMKCAICGEKQKVEELFSANFDIRGIDSKTFSARRVPDRVHYRFVRCKRCGLVFSNPIFEPQKITKLYKRSGFDYGRESEFLKTTYGNYLKEILPKKNLEFLRLLDIGAGNGFFLEKAKELGIKNVWGIEPGKETIKKARKDIRSKIKNDILKSGLFKNNYFDIICCFHTLDHIVDPNKFLQIVFKLLKKGGAALFIVHDTDGLSVKIFGEKSPIFDIEHIYLFNKTNIARLFRKNGFIRARTFDVRNIYPLSYWQRMMPFPEKPKKFISQFLRRMKLDSITISLKVGNIGIVAVK